MCLKIPTAVSWRFPKPSSCICICAQYFSSCTAVVITLILIRARSNELTELYIFFPCNCAQVQHPGVQGDQGKYFGRIFTQNIVLVLEWGTLLSFGNIWAFRGASDQSCFLFLVWFFLMPLKKPQWAWASLPGSWQRQWLQGTAHRAKVNPTTTSGLTFPPSTLWTEYLLANSVSNTLG